MSVFEEFLEAVGGGDVALLVRDSPAGTEATLRLI
jgi:hypothetical protein